MRQQAVKPIDAYRLDPWLVLSVTTLLILGSIMVYSTTITADGKTLALSNKYLFKHLTHVAIGLMLASLAAFIRLQWLQSNSKLILLMALVLLGVLVIPGVGIEVNGSVRWLELNGIRLQPSEMIKLATLIYFADYLSRKHHELHKFRVGILNVSIVIGLIGFLLLMEPDFGATVVITLTTIGLVFLAGVRFSFFMLSIGVMAMIMLLMIWIEPYRIARLMVYRDPWVDPFGSGFQLVQALIAIGRGEWFGVGLGNSIQKLFYLPHVENDFIAAIIGEELGAFGIFSVISLFIILFLRAFAIARRSIVQGYYFSGFLAQGIGLLLALQAAIHLGVNTGLLPTKGLTLPLMSYGGTSMTTSMVAVGLLIAVDRESRPRPGRRR